MNMKITTLTLISIASLLFTSCDSSTPLDTGVNILERATVLRVPADGDTLVFSNIDDKSAPFVGQFVFEGARTITPIFVYDYRQITRYRFDLNLTRLVSSDRALDDALSNILGDPTPLSSRFRQLIFREDDDFSTEELQEIASLLNPSGAALLVDPDDPLKLLSTADRVYHFEVTSNVGDQLRGSMGGTYFTEENSYQVGFRNPTGAELNRYRFLTINHKLPFISGLTNGIRVTEKGTFIMDLVNRDNQPR